MTAIVAVDIGGTHARFALAEVEAGKVIQLGESVTLKTAEHASFQTAWQEFQRMNGAAFDSGERFVEINQARPRHDPFNRNPAVAFA